MTENLNPTTRYTESPSSSPSFTRDSSPSPSISPSPALSAYPPSDRSFSTTSSISTFSGRSSVSRSSSGSAVSRRRGYVRPQGASFAESAKNRDSVMSLGSIAHLQYYFARTGLLDGKGGQLAKDRKSDGGVVGLLEGAQNAQSVDLSYVIVDNAIEEEDESQGWEEQLMLPPTVSTYSHRTQYVPPPPNAETLRTNLYSALNDVTAALNEACDYAEANLDQRKTKIGPFDHPSSATDGGEVESSMHSFAQGWYEIQGMHILDVATLAIRAAKIYYTTHEHPQRLAGIKSERVVRQELLRVLEVLQRMASRTFSGGIRAEEIKTIDEWVRGVETLLLQERRIEQQEVEDRESWKWLEGSWDEDDVQREWLFMCTFLPERSLPAPTLLSEGEMLPTPFLESLRDGLTLVHLHNLVLKKSKRQFGEIKLFHTDTTKPYRSAENLRFWVKAAEIRWEIKLQVNVLAVVYGKNDMAWTEFQIAIFQWCKVVREAITKEWREGNIQAFLPNPEIESEYYDV
ncbi:hypothetical protein MMC06_001134 [Schaereria dolodes]|nr:hypothetical protein [Schaereria dolodes]